MQRPRARAVKGFRDIFSRDLLLKQRLIDAVRGVYERYGFVPLETPAVEFVDALGKFLPESQTPEGGIFSFRNPDLGAQADPADPDQWLALRYDLTAPLARVVAQYPELPRPFRRYQLGPVWRYEKPGVGRFREFYQLDFDSVGVPTVDADAEACAVMCDVFEALGFKRGEYVVRVNDRKVMQGVLEACGLESTDIGNEESRAAAVLRSVDKLDRLGLDGVRELLGKGRKDPTGDFTPGAGLNAKQIEKVEAYLSAQAERRSAVCDRLFELIGDSEVGREGIDELRAIDELLTSLDYGDDRVVFDPTVVRGLSYYTGPVFEGQLTREIKDEDGRTRQFGTVFGGGRYDDLIERFTGEKVPATGASVGVDRLLEAVKLLEQEERPACTAQVLVTVLDRKYMPRYFAMASRIRRAGIGVEVFLGDARIGRQLKYADKTEIPLAIIAGGDEFDKDEVQVKDLGVGRRLAEKIKDRDEWRSERPAQQAVPISELVEKLKQMLAQTGA